MLASKPIVAVIEDDPHAADALGFILRDWGAEVAVGVAAAKVAQHLGARTGSIAWIITDFDLGPGQNAIVGAKDLAELAPNARVLVLSGTFRGVGAVAAKAAGFDFMAKPAQPEAIIRWLEAAERA